MSDPDSLTEYANKFNFENIKIDYDDPAHYRRMALRFAQEYIRQCSVAGQTLSQTDIDTYIERKYTEICKSFKQKNS